MTVEERIAEFVENQRKLVQMEREAEIEETSRLQATLSARALERRGLCLLGLHVTDEYGGLGGRTLLNLEPKPGTNLSLGRIGTGDIVSLRPMGESDRRNATRNLTSGVVFRATPERLTIALDGDGSNVPSDALRVDRITNDVTYRRLDEALQQLMRYRGGPADRLRKVLFEGKDIAFHSGAADLEDVNEELDASQKEAVTFAMSALDVALIHGPPGTGKTTTLVEIIYQSVRRGERVLANAGSNIAVDNLVEKLVERGLGVVRLGHPARLLPTVIEHSLDRLVEKNETSKFAARTRRELDQIHKKIRNARSGRSRHHLRREMREMSAELREVEKWTIQNVIGSADVVLSTSVGAADSNIAGRDFDLVVIDEAAQSLEAACWIPILKGRRLILAGDHRQLPPTICSRRAEKEGLGETLFERLADAFGDRAVRMLKTQYRMNERIMRWSSDELYDGGIEAAPEVATRLLSELPHVETTQDTAIPLLLIDTAGCDLDEREEEDSSSKANEGEAEIAAKHVRQLLDAGVTQKEIGLITPYNAQVRALRKLLRAQYPDLEIGTVDGFQGREKEAIVISMVRSNERGEVGFLADDRRMNVAVTRARRHVAIIADSATVSSHEFLGRLIDYCQAHGEYRTAWEYK